MTNNKSLSCDICGNFDYDVIYSSTITRSINESDFSVFGELGEYSQIVKCTNCNLVYSNPRDSSESLINKYHNLIVSNYLQEIDSRKKTARKDVETLYKYVVGDNFRLLDIGCSSGIFLSSLPAFIEGFGVEPGKQAGVIAKNLIGENKVHIGGIESAPFKPNTFDIITMWDVIEHLESPSKTLSNIKDFLKPNGLLFVMTPNFSSFSSKFMGKRWPNLIRQHLYYYTPETLGKLLELKGFKIIDNLHYSRFFTFVYLYKRLGFPFSGFIEGCFRIFGISKAGCWMNFDGSMLFVARAQVGEA